MAQKLLFMDALNFATKFFPATMHKMLWAHPAQAFKRVKHFAHCVRLDGWQLEVFIDSAGPSEEAKSKWINRREIEVLKCRRMVPQATSVMLGEMFRECGVPVHWSLEADNDDTLVSHALHRKACILSADHDMHRYIYPGEKLTIFPGVSTQPSKHQLYLHKSVHVDYPNKKRDVIQPPPKTASADPNFVRLVKERVYLRGSPTPLTRYYGNPHIVVKPLRTALYHKLGITEPITEEFPEWDTKTQRVKWVKEDVLPDPSLLHLLHPEQLQQAYQTFFGTDVGLPTTNLSFDLWHNHIYGLWATVAELISVGTQKPMFHLLKDAVFPADPRFIRRSSKPSRDPKKSIDGPRDPRDSRGPRDPRDPRDSRDPRDPRDSRDPRDPRNGARDPRDGARDPRDFPRYARDGPRDPRDAPRDLRDIPRDPRDVPRDLRDGPRDPRDGARDYRDGARSWQDDSRNADR